MTADPRRWVSIIDRRSGRVVGKVRAHSTVAAVDAWQRQQGRTVNVEWLRAQYPGRWVDVPIGRRLIARNGKAEHDRMREAG